MHWQLYIPGVPIDRPLQDPRPLVAVGLADCAQAFDASRELAAPRCCAEGTTGLHYAWLSPQSPRIIAPELLQWHAAVAWDGLPAGRYFVGVDSVRPPRPDELRRPWQFPGRPIELGPAEHATQWLVPEPERLPREIAIADDGSLRYEVVRNFHGYTLDAQFVGECETWRQRINDGLQEAQFAECLRFALRALRLNYRLTPEVANALKLFTTENVHRPLLAAVGAYLARDAERT